MSRLKTTCETTFNGYQLYQGKKAEEGFSEEILSTLISMITSSLERHSQVLMVCLQFNFPAEIEVEGINNDCFQSFIESYKRSLVHQGLDPEYLWVRENGLLNNRCHYHLLLLMDGNKIRYFANPFEVKKYWQRALQKYFTYDKNIAPVHIQTLPQLQRGIMIKRSDPTAINLAVELGSYLAKIASKNNIGKYVRVFSSSQFNTRSSK